MNKLILQLALLMVSFSLLAQQPYEIGKDELLLQGYQTKIEGTDFTYHSAIPNSKQSMLVRANNGRQYMIWETEAVPEDFSSEYATFVWLASVGCNVANVRMDLLINEKYEMAFSTQRATNWSQTNDEGMTLSWYSDYVDKAGDRSGFMFLKVPRKYLKAGEALQLKVTGSKANSTAWYMTFKSQIQSGLELQAFPAEIKSNKGNEQVVAASIYYFNRPSKGTLYKDGKKVKSIDLNFGYNFVTIGVPAVTQKQETALEIKADGLVQKKTITLSPIKKWRVNFVQHSHTDIGYTRPQTEIMGEHLRYIDYALDFCDATDHYPTAAQFRWTCEAAFAVEAYLKSRPREQVQKLKERIKEGRIEVTGMYFNFDEMPDEQTLAASLEPFKTFRKENIPVQMAMQNDVNGIGWCFNDYFNTLGVKYLNMGTHGHRALICFDKPTAFWWESPSGKRMLTFRAEHYMTGNTVFGIHTDNFREFEDKLMNYLIELNQKGYEFNTIPIQYSGYLTDNAPPSTLANDMIKKWNEKYQWPQLRQALASEFFEEMEAEHANELPVYRGAWPDWWTDGFASGAREAAASRTTHTDLIAYQGALSMAALMGSELPEGINERIYEANKALLYYDEHTFGAAESISDPYGQNTMDQRALKESYVYEAFRRSRMVGEEVMGLLQSHFTKEKDPSLLVFNTLNYQRSGLVEVYIDHQLLPPGKDFSFTDRAGKHMPAQQLSSRHDGTYWGIWVKDIPAMGHKKLLLKVTDQQNTTEIGASQPHAQTLENAYYKLDIDVATGSLSSLIDKETNQQLLDKEAPWGLGQFIYERLGNRSQMEAYKLDDYERFPLDSVWIEKQTTGDIWNSIVLGAESQSAIGPKGVQIEIRLYNSTKLIDFVYTIRKKPITEPEGIYIAFPFKADNAKHYFEVQGGIIEAGVDQIPGSSNDWNTVQNFAALRNKDMQILLSSKEVPLMQFGNINTGRYKAGATPEHSHIYGWPMNNYWTTNFNADQRGEMTFSYRLTTSEQTDNNTATRFGWGERVPLLGRILPPGTAKKDQNDKSVLSLGADNVQLINARALEGESALILHLREINGKEADLNITSALHDKLKLEEVDVLGTALDKQSNKLTIKPLETKFVKVTW